MLNRRPPAPIAEGTVHARRSGGSDRRTDSSRSRPGARAARAAPPPRASANAAIIHTNFLPSGIGGPAQWQDALAAAAPACARQRSSPAAAVADRGNRWLSAETARRCDPAAGEAGEPIPLRSMLFRGIVYRRRVRLSRRRRATAAAAIGGRRPATAASRSRIPFGPPTARALPGRSKIRRSTPSTGGWQLPAGPTSTRASRSRSCAICRDSNTRRMSTRSPDFDNQRIDDDAGLPQRRL